MNQAFILGAGLGTRLRPLTLHVPKPLVPLFHRPLAAWTVAACKRAGIRRFAVNTHHLPEEWASFSAATGLGAEQLAFFHEPLLLDTGGGLKQLEHWAGEEPLLIHNGDIFSTLPLEKLIAAHKASGLPVTLALRSSGADRRVAYDAASGLAIDVRHELGVAKGTHVFSGIYCANREVFDLIPAGLVASIIPAFLELARQQRLGAVVLDDGVWLDLGDRESYLDAHRSLSLGPPVHPDARIEPGAIIRDSVVGPGAVIESGAVVDHSVVWSGAQVRGNAVLESCIVCSARPASGHHVGADL